VHNFYLLEIRTLDSAPLYGLIIAEIIKKVKIIHTPKQYLQIVIIMIKISRMRLDVFLVQQNLYPTRAKAVMAIKSGLVLVNGAVCKKPSQIILLSDKVKVNSLPFVSGRGSMKLAHALDWFGINPTGFTCLDVGASTGGFTETLLNRGAAKVYAVDVGTAQLISELRNDPRVISLENTDIRALHPFQPVDLVVIDVSFISLSEIADAVSKWNAKKIIALIKPQFEVSRAIAARTHGVIKSDKYRTESIDKAVKAFAVVGYNCIGITESPIRGGSGNMEFLAFFQMR
jgi:23S rRNA (cytidine1920-2'-O)/16S rRNA (cytidine1409-2'-O)-methyltransferase